MSRRGFVGWTPAVDAAVDGVVISRPISFAFAVEVARAGCGAQLQGQGADLARALGAFLAATDDAAAVAALHELERSAAAAARTTDPLEQAAQALEQITIDDLRSLIADSAKRAAVDDHGSPIASTVFVWTGHDNPADVDPSDT